MEIDINKIKEEINNSDLEQYLKDAFNKMVLDAPKLMSGYDWSGQTNCNNKLIEYYLLTNDKYTDYKVVYNNKNKKFGLACSGTITSKDEFNGKFVEYVLNWYDTPMEVIENM